MSAIPEPPPTHINDGADPMLEVQRSLGRIEGLQKQFLVVLEGHKEDDKDAFAGLAATKKDDDKALDERFASVEQKIAAIEGEQNRAKGAGWVILAVLSSMATFVGAAVISVIEGKVHIRF